MLSSWHNCDSETCVRRVRGGREEEAEKPIVISDYTEHMGAVDRVDHYCASYSFSRKTLRWWRKILADGDVCSEFFHPVQESNWTTRTWCTGKTASCSFLKQLGTVMPKSEAGQIWQMITKGSEKYHMLSQMPAVEEIKSAWHVPHGSSRNQLSTIAILARENLV